MTDKLSCNTNELEDPQHLYGAQDDPTELVESSDSDRRTNVSNRLGIDFDIDEGGVFFDNEHYTMQTVFGILNDGEADNEIPWDNHINMRYDTFNRRSDAINIEDDRVSLGSEQSTLSTSNNSEEDITRIYENNIDDDDRYELVEDVEAAEEIWQQHIQSCKSCLPLFQNELQMTKYYVQCTIISTKFKLMRVMKATGMLTSNEIFTPRVSDNNSADRQQCNWLMFSFIIALQLIFIY